MGELMSTRDVYGRTLAELGKENERIVVLDADVSSCTRTCEFEKLFPNRFFNLGIAEADMMATAAGLAACGKTPFASTFAVFAAGRAFDQVRNSIAYPNLNVKICATHAGLSVGPDGGSHQSVEDLALMRALPNMRVVSPADVVETAAAVRAAAESDGPWYIRLGRSDRSVLFDPETYKFELGKAVTMQDGDALTIIATGPMVAEALKAAVRLKDAGINARVLNMHTSKPIDKAAIVAAARETGGILTVEDHSVIGGLASAVSEVLVQAGCSVRIRFLGIQDTFGVSGDPQDLYELFGLSPDAIYQAALDLVRRRD